MYKSIINLGNNKKNGKLFKIVTLNLFQGLTIGQIPKQVRNDGTLNTKGIFCNFISYSLNFLTILKNEILSYFVPEKMEYKITGECLKCGKCCRYMYSFDTYTTTDFKIMQFLFPAYKRFYIKGKDEEGNLIFACKYVTDEGLCSVYDKRLKMCRNYPAKKISYPGKLHEGCGYRVEDKSFESYLNK